MARDDYEIIAACKDKQEDACHELMRRYEGYVFKLCFNFTGQREDALDLTQEVFFKVFNNLSSYQLGRPFKPWLRQVAVNMAINSIQKHSSPLSLDQPLADGKATLADTLAATDDPAREIEWQETGQILKDAIKRLPQVYRLIVVLRHQEGMTYQEIADASGIPLGTVKTYLFRARSLLRKDLASYYAWEV